MIKYFNKRFTMVYCAFRRSKPFMYTLYEPRHEITGLQGFRPGVTKKSLLKFRNELEP